MRVTRPTSIAEPRSTTTDSCRIIPGTGESMYDTTLDTSHTHSPDPPSSSPSR